MTEKVRTTILLARHGECRGNVEGLFRGRADFPLNERGVRQAGELAEALRPWEPAVVYTSPLLRARATAEAIAAACGAELRVDEGMNNMALGVWEGRRKTEVAKERPDLWRLWMENPEELVVDGAETMRDVMLRSMSSLRAIVAENRGKTVAAVTHRTVIKPLIAGCIGIASPYFWKVHMDTAAYSVLHHDDLHGFSLFALNRTEHLSGFATEWE